MQLQEDPSVVCAELQPTLRAPRLYKSAAVVRKGPSLVLEVACG